MTNPSAHAGPARARRVIISAALVPCAPLVAGALLVQGLLSPSLADPSHDASSLTVQPAASASQQAPQALPFPTFLDDRRLQAIEGQAKPRLDAIEQRRSEKLRRKAIEADVKRKAEDMRRSVERTTVDAPASPGEAIVDLIKPTQANAAPMPPAGTRSGAPAPLRATTGLTLPFMAAPAPPRNSADCSAGTTATSPLPGGRVAIDVVEPCRKGEMVTIRYAPYVFLRPLDADGRLRFVLDLFQGPDAALSIVFKSGESRSVAIGPTDIERVSKVAVIWGKPVNLDLHVFEYAASVGTAGHVWSKSPSEAAAAQAESARAQRGRGFLSFSSDGTQPGHQVEVYTLWHHAGQVGGVVATALDYETRGTALGGATCGDGELAEIPFETITLIPRRPTLRERGLIPRARCGDTLIEKARYQDDAIADLPLALE